MAHMTQEEKKEIAAKLKEFMPKGWKHTLSVRNNTGIVFKLSQAPADLLAEADKNQSKVIRQDDTDLNHLQTRGYFEPYHARLSEYFDESLALFERIVEVLNLNNYDRSDVQSDYFNIGHYVYIKIGTYDKPFKYVEPDLSGQKLPSRKKSSNAPAKDA